jgi:hypothetical protein
MSPPVVHSWGRSVSEYFSALFSIRNLCQEVALKEEDVLDIFQLMKKEGLTITVNRISDQNIWKTH